MHGTWVSGTKIEPNIPVDIKEGDILRLGTSAREYRFHWLSLNKAYEMENPLPPLIEEKEATHQVRRIILEFPKVSSQFFKDTLYMLACLGQKSTRQALNKDPLLSFKFGWYLYMVFIILGRSLFFI